MKHKPYGFYEKFVKRPLDCLLAAFALIVLWPVLLTTALLVYVKLGSPVLFAQERPGKEEKVFKLLKFRTMADQKDADGNLLPDDVRLTSFGRKLRATSLDELPELINIIKGDMAVVGPRPLLVEYLPWYTEEQRKRHMVRPGLTGYAQAHGRNLVSWDDKFAMDVEYVGHISFRKDFQIILDTVKAVLQHEGIHSAASVTMESFVDYCKSMGREPIWGRFLIGERMNMDNPLISVIVPVYMIERYAGACIESIINQTYRNLEIILVDDGGRDRCPELCDLYAAKDKRIKVIHKSNGGLVSARKAGLRESNGEYVSYVDGDDWIGPGFIEGLYTAAVMSGADMVCAGFTRDLFSKSASFTDSLPLGIYEGGRLRELWKSMISASPRYRPGISTYVWNKLFRRKILLDTQTMVDNRISIGEDGAVTYPALLKCKTVAVIDNVAYHYRQREDSMLKQSTGYLAEAQKLLYLYEYMLRWAGTTDSKWNILSQVQDYILSMAIIRSGGRLPQDGFRIFHSDYYGKNVVVYSAGTFGQQLVNRFKETEYCRIVAWLDDDYWEYRRCCLDVEPVESVTSLSYDYILIATVDGGVARSVMSRLQDLGASKEKILTVTIPENKEDLLSRFLDIEAIREEEA